MTCLILWLIGWFILSLGNYIYKVYINKDRWNSKKLHAWRSFWAGISSWFGIVFLVSLYIVYIICKANDWIENKLNK